jgi:uncharacterized protein
MTKQTLSKHTIVSKIKGTDNYFLLNTLYGSVDIISKDDYEKSKEQPFDQELIDKGYVADTEKEKNNFLVQYLNFCESRDAGETQLFFAPWYSCNFNCSYCYQEEYENANVALTFDIINAFFSYVTETFKDKPKYITLFGGEPLLAGIKQKTLITYFLNKAAKHNIQITIVTNGYNISEYLKLFDPSLIREIQVTLDGTKKIHDLRRPLKDGGSTFDKIADGISALLEKNISVNLRMVVDKENINELIELAELAKNKGWTKNPLFKTQLGRNYELHSCQSNAAKLFSRIELAETLYELIEKEPSLTKFHKPAFSIAKYLQENGTLPEALFDSCPGCKTEWAFDYTGQIYPCTANVGKKGEEVGTYFPKIKINTEKTKEWQKRDVTTIPECKDCNVQLACGGGCAAVAKNSHGAILKPDCRPVKELLELGLGLYFKKEVKSI